VIEDLLSQIAVLLVGVPPHRFAQLLPGDMPLGLIFRVVDIRVGRGPKPQLVLRESQRFEHKHVGVEVVTPVVAQQLGDGVGWV
jgi:hypothetical protein